jgi:hypothetical protein
MPYLPSALRRLILERAQGRCEYCQLPMAYSPDIFEVEHILPLAGGGATELENLALACSSCNRYKGTRTSAQDPRSGRRVRLFNPRRQRWERHFRWSEDFTEIEGRTATGRATVEALRMNREPLRRLRAALYALGLHPAQQKQRSA